MSRIPGMSRSTEYTVPSMSLAEKARYTVEQEPSSGSGNYGPTNRRQITFHVPAQEFVEARATMLSFDLQLSATYETPAADNHIILDNPGGAAVVRRLVLRDQSGKVIEEIDDANLLSCFLQRSKGADWGASIGKNMTGFSSILDENMEANPGVPLPLAGLTNAAAYASYSALRADISAGTSAVSNTQEFCVPLCLFGLGLLGTASKTIPMKYLAKAGPALVLDVYLEDANNVVTHVTQRAGTATTKVIPNYTVSNVKLILEQVEPTLAFDSNFAQAVTQSPDGVKMFFKSYTNHSDQITTARHTSDFSAYEFSLNHAVCIMRNIAGLNNVGHHSLSGWSNASATSAQTRLGHQVNPVRPYEMRVSSNNARAYSAVLAVLGKICSEKAVDFRKWAAGAVNVEQAHQFCLAFNWDKQEAIDDENYVLSGADTRSGSIPLSLTIQREAGASTSYQLTCFTGADRMVSITPGGLVVGQTSS